MSDFKENPKQWYFYYRYCKTTKKETFITRETPITDNIDELYSGYPCDVELPIGTIFSIVCRLIEFILVPVSTETVINRMLDCLEKLDDIDDIKEALKLFVLMSYINKDYCNIKDNENTAIYNLNMFVTECFRNTTYATNEYLEKIILTHNLPFPKTDKIIVDYSYAKEQREYADKDMKKFLDNKLPNQQEWKKLFKGITVYDFDYYAVDTMSGLIITLLKVIFDNRKIINICEHCYNCFVPLKRSDEKYCTTNKYFGNQDCKMEIRMEQQRKRLSLKQSEVDKMERSVRTMIYYRANQALPKNQISDKEFKKYKKQINDFKNSVTMGKHTVEEYKEFLKTFYKKGK